jgi:hypothetical protein
MTSGLFRQSVRSGIAGEVGIVVLRTANVCRSPMAAALLARRLATLGVTMRERSAGMIRETRHTRKHLGHGLVRDKDRLPLISSVIEGTTLGVRLHRSAWAVKQLKVADMNVVGSVDHRTVPRTLR